MSFLRSYSPEKPSNLAAHAGLMAIWSGGVATFAVAQRRSGRTLPNRIPAGDLALLAVATYKLSRLIAKDRVTSVVRAPFTRFKGDSERPSEVVEEPRGSGLQRAVGELVTCPYCLAQWVGTSLLGLYLLKPRLARTTGSLFAIVSGSDLLQEAWVAVGRRA
jgi:hypothetical protein